MKNQRKGLRLEQVLEFTLGAAEITDWTPFFRDMFQKIMRGFGLSCRLADSNEKNDLGFPNQEPLVLTLLNGVSLMDLQPILVGHHVWPGLLIPYLKIFKSLVQRYIHYIERPGAERFLPTASLEVLATCERIMSYLFSGDIRKIGKAKISDLGLRNSLLHMNFPYLPPPHYRYGSNDPNELDNHFTEIDILNWVQDDSKHNCLFLFFYPT
jgi:hypothetical protein